MGVLALKCTNCNSSHWLWIFIIKCRMGGVGLVPISQRRKGLHPGRFRGNWGKSPGRLHQWWRGASIGSVRTRHSASANRSNWRRPGTTWTWTDDWRGWTPHALARGGNLVFPHSHSGSSSWSPTVMAMGRSGLNQVVEVLMCTLCYWCSGRNTIQYNTRSVIKSRFRGNALHFAAGKLETLI